MQYSFPIALQQGMGMWVYVGEGGPRLSKWGVPLHSQSHIFDPYLVVVQQGIDIALNLNPLKIGNKINLCS